jgi:ANTAR domain/GAF domain
MPADWRNNAIFAELGALVADLQRNPPDTEHGLAELVDLASRGVLGAQYAAITLANRARGISTPAATHRYPVLLDEIQQQHQDGPCLSAAWEHHIMRIDDLAAEMRWPDYRQDVLAQTPVRSVLSFELAVSPDTLTALNFYAERPGAFNAESVELGMIFATHTALAWRMLSRDEQFRSALAVRDIIGQAKGILMERFNLDAVEAFNLLTQFSQENNSNVAELAQRLVNEEHPSPPKTQP